MCSVIQCGFPLYSEAQAAFPALLTEKPSYRPHKVWDFKRHLFAESLLEDRVIQADGYKYASGWYHEHNYSDWCVHKLSGCVSGDISCEVTLPYHHSMHVMFDLKSDISSFFRIAMRTRNLSVVHLKVMLMHLFINILSVSHPISRKACYHYHML